ncbi:MAG: putative metal-binding motif-containing protein [Sandaracinaceae bacterium]
MRRVWTGRDLHTQSGRCILVSGADGGQTDAGGARCASNRDCGDGVYCNGEETCEPGRDGADAQGCVAASAPCSDGEMCDEPRERCVVVGCETPDVDGDGSLRIDCGGDDCDDADGNRFPGNVEVCDPHAHDEDCDPSTFGFRDADRDGYLDAACCNVDDEGVRRRGDDCDDTRLIRHPGRLEVCAAFDNDCDDETDEGVVPTFYADTDGDGFGDPDSAVSQCLAPVGYVDLNTDCDDDYRSVNPAAREVCDGIDNNCDGLAADATVDECVCVEGQVTECGVSMMGECQLGERRCGSEGRYGACEGSVDPRPEGCNELDDDCDGDVDEGVLTVCYRDGDDDGFGRNDDSVATCGACPEDYVSRGGDCDDAREDTNPLAFELCDRRDNDCSSGGGTDVAEDADNDGHSPPAAACSGGFLKDDCRDANPMVSPTQSSYVRIPFCGRNQVWCEVAGCCLSPSTECNAVAGFTICTIPGVASDSYCYNCDGVEEFTPLSAGCVLGFAGCSGEGPTESASACDAVVSYRECRLVGTINGDECRETLTTRRPGCR